MISCAALPGQGRCGSTATHPPCCSCCCCASHGPMRRDGGVISTLSGTAGLIAHGSPLCRLDLLHPHGLNERSRRWLRIDLDPLAGRAKREGDVPAGLLGNPVPRWPLLSALWRAPTQGADGAGAMAQWRNARGWSPRGQSGPAQRAPSPRMGNTLHAAAMPCSACTIGVSVSECSGKPRCANSIPSIQPWPQPLNWCRLAWRRWAQCSQKGGIRQQTVLLSKRLR